MKLNHFICPKCGHHFYKDTAYATCDACQCFFYASQSRTCDVNKSFNPTYKTTITMGKEQAMKPIEESLRVAREKRRIFDEDQKIVYGYGWEDAVAAERERCAKDVNDLREVESVLLASISRIRWARGTNKLDEAIRQAIKIQTTIDSKKAIRATPASETQPDYLNLTAAEAIELEDMERRGVGFKRSASAPEPPAKVKG